MAIPKKGTRKITVDQASFRYVIKAGGVTSTLTVQEDAEKTGSVLQVSFNREESVKPTDVADYIRQAQKQGWNPSKVGPTFRLSFTVAQPA